MKRRTRVIGDLLRFYTPTVDGRVIESWSWGQVQPVRLFIRYTDGGYDTSTEIGHVDYFWRDDGDGSLRCRADLDASWRLRRQISRGEWFMSAGLREVEIPAKAWHTKHGLVEGVVMIFPEVLIDYVVLLPAAEAPWPDMQLMVTKVR